MSIMSYLCVEDNLYGKEVLSVGTNGWNGVEGNKKKGLYIKKKLAIIEDEWRSKMRIYLIRHAKQESKLCNDNTALCEIGRKQAHLLGKRLRNYHIDAVYSSDLLRAEETAQIVAKELEEPMEVNIREGLRETDFGELTFQTDDDIKVKYKEFMESRYHVEEDWAYPGGESGQEVFKRSIEVIEEITRLDKKNVAVVTHGGTIRVLLAGLFQKGQKDRLLISKTMERGGFSEIYYEEKTGRFYLERVNDFAHLEDHPECMMRKDH